uniref:Receptor kinase n=1 Tax=Solanum tuberosum TaxID=4113 RepID=M1DAJ1_SOLTU
MWPETRKSHPFESQRAEVGSDSGHIGNLSLLNSLDLAKNAFHDKIPQQLSRLSITTKRKKNFRYRYSGSSTGASLIPHGVRVSYGEPPCFRRVPILLSVISVVRRSRVLSRLPSLSFRGFIGSQDEGSLGDQQWSSSVDYVQVVDSGRDKLGIRTQSSSFLGCL